MGKNTAWFVTNGFISEQKFTDICYKFQEMAKKYQINLLIKTNIDLMYCLENDGFIEEKPEFVIFWDKDIKLAMYLEQQGLLVFNSSKAIEICDDKALTHMVLHSHNILMPKTIISPKTYKGLKTYNEQYIDFIQRNLGYPMIIKECFGSFGEQVYLVNHHAELVNTILALGTEQFICQEYIKSSHGKDIRLYVVGEEVIASIFRYSTNHDFRANALGNSSAQEYIPTGREKEIAIECCRFIGLDYGGVDILFGENGEPVVCEVNSNAHFKKILECTGIDMVDKIISYIVNKI